MLLILFSGFAVIQGLILIALAGQTQSLTAALIGLNSLFIAFFSIILRIIFDIYDHYIR